jgi:hypothetical protein
MVPQMPNSLSSMIEQYIKLTKPLLCSTDKGYNHIVSSDNTIKAIDLSKILNNKGIFFRHIENNDLFEYELILPTTISKLNLYLDLSEIDRIVDGMDMYFPPNPIIDILDENALNAGVICVEETGSNSISVLCEHYGHAVGFLRYYSNNVYKK